MIRKLIDSPATYFILAGLLLLAAVLSQLRLASGEDAPHGTVAEIESLAQRDDVNLIFILVDTLRADRLSAYGYPRQTSPNLDALAARGIRFASVEAQSSYTKASMGSLWTARYPERSGITLSSQAMPAEATLPAELFKDAGYVTAGVWRNGWIASNFGFDQGFDFYYRPTPNESGKLIQRSSPSAERLQGTDLDITQSAIEFITAHRSDRFFLYLHYMDVHQYVYNDVSPPWGSGYSDIYDRAIHWTDQNLGLLVNTLYEEKLLGKTVIVIGSDHGEAFFEHGSEGHGTELYGELLQVPLIIVPPFTLEEGVVVEEPVANIDIWPTLLEIMGLPPVPGAEGRSLLPLLLDSDEDSESTGSLRARPLFAQLNRGWGKRRKTTDRLVSMLHDSHRFIFRENRPEESEAYDLSVDPGEQNNILTAGDERSAAFQARVQEFLDVGPPTWGEPPVVEIDEMMRNQLRALGYVTPRTN
ncbi:MAG: sulfatase, partial [Myxococcota bacterium]